MVLIHKIHVLELQIKTNVYDLSSFKCYLRNSERGLKNSGMNIGVWGGGPGGGGRAAVTPKIWVT